MDYKQTRYLFNSYLSIKYLNESKPRLDLGLDYYNKGVIMNKAKKIIKKILLTFLILIVLYVTFTFIYTNIKYNEYNKIILENTYVKENSIRHVDNKTGYYLNIMKGPISLMPGNFLSIQYETSTENASLFIWPFSFGVKYGLSLHAETETGLLDGSNFNSDKPVANIGFTSYQFYVDKDMNPTQELTDIEQELYNKYKDQIKKLNLRAQELWNLN